MSSTTITRRRAPLSTQERQERQTELLNTLADGVAELATSQGWARFLRAMSTLRHYSVNNQLLILAQRPDATRVAGYRTWQSLGRQVRKGATGIRIFGYATAKVTAQDNETTPATDSAAGEQEPRRRVYFPIRTVFDISDTEGPSIDGPVTDILPGQHDTAQHDTAQAITGDLTQWLTSTEQGWTLTQQPLSGGVRGYTAHGTRQIVLAEDLDATNAARVLLHEACHAVLHGPDSPYVTGQQYTASQRHRGTAEVQADGAAYVLGQLLGLDTHQAAVGYVAGWATAAAASSDPTAIAAAVRAAADAVHHAVTTIGAGIGLDAPAAD